MGLPPIFRLKESNSVKTPMFSNQQTIPEHLLRARLEQSEQMREFLIQIWQKNSQLLAQAGDRAQMIMKEAMTMPKSPLEPAESSIEL